jgi:tetratricopeptide (TPR) repeat protein
MPEGVGLQPIRDIVVQIRHTVTDEIVGTGFVAKEGIVTCVHVVRDAGVDTRAPEGEVGVYSPEREGQSVSRRARVKGCFPEHDDDVVLLQLADGQSPLGPELAAVMGPAKGSMLHDFQSFGFRARDKFRGLYAYGRILGNVPRPADKKLHGEPLMLSSQNIDRGMSGTPVLDIQRNLITGIIYLSWDSAGAACDRDTGFAVDAKVLSFEPLDLALQDEDLPKAQAPEPKVDIPAERARVAPIEPLLWNDAPTSLVEWVGRDQLLDEITSDWVNPAVRITGLIGFGGEGKSSLARRWVEDLLAGKSLPRPDGLFWWGFYERRNVDEFFEAALSYLSGGRIDPDKIPSASMRAQIIAAMLGAGRYIFILDGLEVLQHQDGDLYGSLCSPDLKAFLQFFASPDHKSFCLATSRAPLMDLYEYTTYQHRDVDRLSPKDGRDLLRRLGVQGEDEKLDRVVEYWDGHALTLSLLASYLVDHHGGDIKRINNIPPPTAKESRYERVNRVLRRYDEHLDDSEKAFLKLFSAFRIPVNKAALDKVFRAKSEGRTTALNAPIIALGDDEFQVMVKRLVVYRILRYNPKPLKYGHFTIHPIIRDHYFKLLTEGDQEQVKEAHELIKDFYLARSQYMPDTPNLLGFSSLIEFVYHACQCGAYDEALGIHIDRMLRKNDFYITHKLGAWACELGIMQEFFHGGDFYQDPLVTSSRDKGWVLNEVGLCLEIVGKGNLAEGFFERALTISLDSDNWGDASVGYRNLSTMYLRSGELAKGLQSATKSLEMAQRAGREDFESASRAIQLWAHHLQGNLKKSRRIFRRIKKENKFSAQYFYGSGGIYIADYFRRRGDADNSRMVIEATLADCERRNQCISHLSLCHRVLGDLYVETCQWDRVSENYDLALDVARNISDKVVLIEALQARGRWEARQLNDPVPAFSDLKEALDYARVGGYRLYEADIRVALAWAHLAAKNERSAREEAAYALQMSEEMGYHWGKVDANEVLAEIASRKAVLAG